MKELIKRRYEKLNNSESKFQSQNTKQIDKSQTYQSEDYLSYESSFYKIALHINEKKEGELIFSGKRSFHSPNFENYQKSISERESNAFLVNNHWLKTNLKEVKDSAISCRVTPSDDKSSLSEVLSTVYQDYSQKMIEDTMPYVSIKNDEKLLDKLRMIERNKQYADLDSEINLRSISQQIEHLDRMIVQKKQNKEQTLDQIETSVNQYKEIRHLTESYQYLWTKKMKGIIEIDQTGDEESNTEDDNRTPEEDKTNAMIKNDDQSRE